MSKNTFGTIIGSLILGVISFELTRYYDKKGFNRCLKLIKDNNWKITTEDGDNVAICIK